MNGRLNYSKCLTIFRGYLITPGNAVYGGAQEPTTTRLYLPTCSTCLQTQTQCWSVSIRGVDVMRHGGGVDGRSDANKLIMRE